MKEKKNTKTIILIIIALFVLNSCISKNNDSHINIHTYLQNDTFNIISSSENKVIDSAIKDYAKKNKIDVSIDYVDTLDIADKINAGEEYDAIWLSNSIWLYQIDSSVASVKNSKSLSINPVIFGIKKSKAEELGFVDKDIYTKDIVNAVKSGKLKFSMANPVSTNAGASAYLGILQTLAGNPEVLTSDILKNKELKEELKTFFTGLERTSGSEDFLEELFLKGDYDAVVTYESSIIDINRKLEKSKKETLYALYPIDGVSIADSVFAYIDNKDDEKAEQFSKLQSYLLSKDGQKVLEQNGRRTWFGGVNENAPKNIFNPEWGIDTTKYITPIKYPSTDVINEALALYQESLRKPVHVVFCLDYSGSMYNGIDELKESMDFLLTSEKAKTSFIQFTEEDKIDIVPFESNVGEVWSTTDGSQTEQLLEKINSKNPNGTTALYPAAIKALEILENEDMNKYNVSIILMTDGAGNVGYFSDLQYEYKKVNKDIPIYSIMFGYADEYELEDIAKLTNGKVFDGKTDLVKAFKTVRGYN